MMGKVDEQDPVRIYRLSGICLNCGMMMQDLGCKMRCYNCGYFESCSELESYEYMVQDTTERAA